MKRYLYLLAVLIVGCTCDKTIEPKPKPKEVITKSYYLEIPSPDNIPEVTKKEGKVVLTFKTTVLTALFKGYVIKKFALAFPGADSELLKIVYSIECDPELIEKIKTEEYRKYFGKCKEVKPIQYL